MIHRSVALAVLYDKKKKILLQYRDKTAPRLPNHWAFFGGAIEKGETPEEAVRREALEELNYQMRKPRLVLEQDFKGNTHYGTKYVFMEEYDSSQSLNLQEGQNYGWFLISETKKLKIADHDKEVLEQIKDKF